MIRQRHSPERPTCQTLRQNLLHYSAPWEVHTFHTAILFLLWKSHHPYGCAWKTSFWTPECPETLILWAFMSSQGVVCPQEATSSHRYRPIPVHHFQRWNLLVPVQYWGNVDSLDVPYPRPLNQSIQSSIHICDVADLVSPEPVSQILCTSCVVFQRG